MTPKKKAKELIDNFTFQCKECDYNWNAKQCALIAVDEIYELKLKHGQYLNEFEDKTNYYSYWEQVKQEINKL